jgi:hypothetical protein
MEREKGRMELDNMGRNLNSMEGMVRSKQDEEKNYKNYMA